MRNDLHNEREVILLIANGDERAYTQIIEQYSAKIYAHILAYLKKPALAEELTQDIMLTVWKHRDKLPAIENFPGWLYVITKNRTQSAFRNLLEHDRLPDHDEIEGQLHTPQDELEYRELNDILQRGISQLPPRRQEVFRMNRFEGKSYEEIAQILGISKSAVNQHIVEAISFLRTWLHQETGLMTLAVILLLPPV